MAEENADGKPTLNEEPWQIKESLIVVPLLASALALTWEVGFFLRIKGSAFGFFNVSEHITFALQALPIALVVSIMIVGQAFQFALIDRYVFPKIRSSRTFQAIKKWNVLAVAYFAIAVGVGVELLYPPPSITVLVLAAIVTAIFTATAVLPRIFKERIVVATVGLLSSFLITFALGIDTARNEIKSERPLNKIEIGEKGKPSEGVLNVRVIRSGDRGILYFDPRKQEFALIPWEAVKRIDWGISPLLTP
jgi:hypothetical protein